MARTLLRCRWLAACLILAPLLPAAAQPPAAAASSPNRSARPDVLDAAARVPPVVHRSPLAQYRRYADEPTGSWREANELVNRIGGWRAYAREAAAPAAPASAPAGVTK